MFLFLAVLDGLLSGAHNEHFMKYNIPTQLDNLTNEDSEIISVDILTNHLESSCHADNISDNGATVNCIPDRQKSVCMKTKLSPASETHPQNNHAFNMGEEPLIMNTCCYGGARPKLPLHSTYSTNQSVSEESGVIGVTVNSNHVSCSKLYSSAESGAKSVSSHNENSAKGRVPDHAENESSNAIVGDYFFANGDARDSKISKNSIHSGSPDSIHKHIPSFVDRYIRSDNLDSIPRWADPACQGIKFADDDEQSIKDMAFEGNIVFDSSQVITPTSDGQKRLYLESSTEPEAKVPEENNQIKSCDLRKQSHDLKMAAKKGSMDICENEVIGFINLEDNLKTDMGVQFKERTKMPNGLEKEYTLLNNKRKSSLLSDFERLDITQTASLPSSPLHRLHKPNSPTMKLKEEVINGKCKHHSPLFKRKSKYPRSVETSEDDCSSSIEDMRISCNFKNLESFQKAQLKNKVRIL